MLDFLKKVFKKEENEEDLEILNELKGEHVINNLPTQNNGNNSLEVNNNQTSNDSFNSIENNLNSLNNNFNNINDTGNNLMTNDLSNNFDNVNNWSNLNNDFDTLNQTSINQPLNTINQDVLTFANTRNNPQNLRPNSIHNLNPMKNNEQFTGFNQNNYTSELQEIKLRLDVIQSKIEKIESKIELIFNALVYKK